MNLPAGSAWRV